MRYDMMADISYEEFSQEYYAEIDKRFFGSVFQIMPWKERPFDNLIDFNSLSGKDVLEVGVGCGTHAQLIAEKSGSFTGIDITDYAINATTKRMDAFAIKADIIRMDAEKMNFEDNSFDFIWSWGVIHHSSNTLQILKEINRVLRPGGKAVVMVYHKSVWNTYIRGALYYGILKGGLFKGKSVHKIIQEKTDGALARYYTIREWNDMLREFFLVGKTLLLGSKSQLVPMPYCKAKEFLMRLIPNWFGRFITNRPFFGFMVVSMLIKETNGKH